MEARTRKLWAKQDQHEGDRERLFRAVAAAVDAHGVLYAGSYVDVAASFAFPDVTYVDVDRRAAQFFADAAGVTAIIEAHPPVPERSAFTFIHGDYTDDLTLGDESFDLLVSLYAGLISDACTRYLRIGGALLVNPSHGDAAMASIDERYQLVGVVEARSGDYRVVTERLDRFLVPKKKDLDVTADLLRETGRGIGYTRPAFAYLFRRIS